MFALISIESTVLLIEKHHYENLMADLYLTFSIWHTNILLGIGVITFVDQ